MIFGLDWSNEAVRLGRRSIDAAMEASVIGSFTRFGYNVRSRLFDWHELPDLTDRTIIITGATSGLGYAAASELSQFGANLMLVGRDRDRTAATAQELNQTTGGNVDYVIADMSELASVRAASAELSELPKIDALLHNAGALLSTYQRTSDGYEKTFAAHVLGPHVMTRTLLPILQRTGDARVVTMTSGGMYAEKLDPAHAMMSRSEYDGVRAYAKAKRAQVALNEQWAFREPSAAVFHTVHPGWAATPGVAASLPRFNRAMGPFLRDPYQGADTMVWLAASDEALLSSGHLWLDRRPRHANKVPWTFTGLAQSTELWNLVEGMTKD
jgi:dehydrogenase/reductase SDR family protein 12